MTRKKDKARRKTALWLGGLASASALVWAALYWLTGASPFGKSAYCTYTLQAMAWRSGSLSLGQDYPWLELAVYNGDWYVSFPPVPTLPVWLMTFVFGENVPDNLLVRLYALGAAIAVFFALRQRRWKRGAAAYVGFLTVFCGSAMALSTEGAVWYQAQMLALFLTALAVALTVRGSVTPALLCYALAVGCRPFNVAYGPLFMLAWRSSQPDRSLRATARGLWKGVALGLLVAGGYAAYNIARFGQPFEFGTSYLPEFMRSAHGEFSLSHVAANVKTFIFGWPFEKQEGAWRIKEFGFSVFLANPLLLCLVIRFARDCLTRRATALKALTMALFAAQLFLLLTHRTFGGYQFGARYAVDLVPYFIFYLCLDERKRLFSWETALGAAGVAFALYGVGQIHI